jgi:hypothetical protein
LFEGVLFTPAYARRSITRRTDPDVAQAGNRFPPSIKCGAGFLRDAL